MSRTRQAHALVALALALAGCRRATPPSPSPSSVGPSASHAHDAGATASDGAGSDAGASLDAHVDAAPAAALTLRVVNTGQQPLTILTNPDTNELVHTRRLRARRNPDAATAAAAEGDLVKFFPVGQMPLCSADGGAGYGGLGQPERRTLAPGEALTFAWDGHLRREVLDPARGVCAEVTTPEPGRYRFEFDQPYNAPGCNRPVVTLPLAPDAPREVEIRCFTRRAPQPE